MLSLKGIVKKYVTGDTTVTALQGVSLDFRRSEFVSVLGPSGCGKTTLLNIIGGLDRYDEGELSIKGRPTSAFRSKDWDSYRNHSIGFVFQSYNLIPHQTVLSNVELALTLSGVSKSERRARAKAALEKVGLGDQLHKKPNQMSGGQMQRVAIARALVNDPEIILADEPTGALDSVTSVQIMEILKSISDEKLIIMVTHNPEIAEKYSTRIIRLNDGRVTGDTNPYDPAAKAQSEETAAAPETSDGENPPKESAAKAPLKQGKTSMSFLTALSLSLNNLMTKKARTFLTSFAGSIGIIGIALILSLSNGINLYIEKVQQDTLSSYPISIAAQTIDYTSMMNSMMGVREGELTHGRDAVYTNTIMTDMINVMMSEVKTNNLSDFKKFLEGKQEQFDTDNLVNDVQYGYNLDLNIYDPDTEDGITKLGMDIFYRIINGSSGTSGQVGMGMNMQVFAEMIDNEELLASQYEVLGNGHFPRNYDEIVLIVNEDNEIADMALYALGLKDQNELLEMMQAAMKGETYEVDPVTFTYDEILNTTFKLVLPSDYYEESSDGKWVDIRENTTAMKRVIDNGLTLKIVGILRPAEDAVSSSINSPVGYTHALTEYIINETNRSAVVAAQEESPDTDILTGFPFPSESDSDQLTAAEKAERFRIYSSGLSNVDLSDLYRKAVVNEDVITYQLLHTETAEKRGLLISAYTATGSDAEAVAAQVAAMSDAEVVEALNSMLSMLIPAMISQNQESFGAMTTDAMALAAQGLIGQMDEEGLAILHDTVMPNGISSSTYEENMALFGQLDLDNPSSINIYPTSFAAKETLTDLISEYNDDAEEQDKIIYTDYVALLMSSVTTIINFVSYALIAFVSISLVVSSIMIGIITYISVLERTKEIGILRAIGASKKDISRVFNAETFIVGFAAGLIGILVSLLLCIPINMIIKALADVSNIAVLPIAGGVILVIISIILTLIAGLIPSRLAAKKDPVIALRTE